MGGNGSGMEEELEARELTDRESTAVVADTRSGARRERMVLQALGNLRRLPTAFFSIPSLDREVADDGVRDLGSLEGIDFAVVGEKLKCCRR